MKKTPEGRPIQYIPVRSPLLYDPEDSSQWKKTLKWAFFERIVQKGQRKMIIYLNPRTVILHEVNNP